MATSSSIQLKLTRLVKQEVEKYLVMEKKLREDIEKGPFAEGEVRMLKKVQGRDWERIMRLQIMVNQSGLSIK
ncbi:hypothetical protein Tco_1378974 [Tanacetum coccineum]